MQASEPFNVGTATAVRFGEGVRNEVGDHVSDDSRVLVVASASSLSRTTLAEWLNDLSSKADVSTFTDVQENPRVSDIDRCVREMGGRNITHVVGIGGGSAIDQAKATAMALHVGGDVAAVRAITGGLPQRSNKLILLPTTSGTGAELSYGSILTDDESGTKFGVRGATVAADVALIDPELTYTVPLDVSLVTGFDVMTHAMETFVSSFANPYTTSQSRAAITRVFEYLPRLMNDLNDAEARSELAFASMLMGQNLALSTTCMPHRLQYPLGAATDSAHAAGLAALYPAWLEHAHVAAQEKFATVLDWIQPNNSASSTQDGAESLVHTIQKFLADIDLDISMQDLGATSEMLAAFPGQVSGRLDTDPSYDGDSAITKIYQASF